MEPKGVVIHYVANPGSSALGNRNYFENAGTASAHYIIDISGEIIRAIPDNEVAWHAGRSFGARWDAMAKTNNSRYIGIECCHPDSGGKYSEATRTALKELVAQLYQKYGFNPKTDIFRHYDVCGKQCPLYYVNNPSEWDKLKAEIIAACTQAKPVTTAPVKPAAAAPVTTAPAKPETGAPGIPILAAPSVTLQQMREWSTAKKAAGFFIEAADIWYKASLSAGVDPAVSYAQAYHETGGGHFGGVLNESYHNPCGMKITVGGGDKEASAHARFPDWRTGIQAQIDHLALYAGAQGYPKANTPDPRHFPYIKGTAVTVQALNGKWASDQGYAVKLASLIESMVKTPALVLYSAAKAA